jgi:hypothetical protein
MRSKESDAEPYQAFARLNLKLNAFDGLMHLCSVHSSEQDQNWLLYVGKTWEIRQISDWQA